MAAFGNTTSLLQGVKNGMVYRKTLLLTNGKSLHPMQRNGSVRPGLGVFAVGDTNPHATTGSNATAAPTNIVPPQKVRFSVPATNYKV